jgi:hypothetical protein
MPYIDSAGRDDEEHKKQNHDSRTTGGGCTRDTRDGRGGCSPVDLLPVDADR